MVLAYKLLIDLCFHHKVINIHTACYLGHSVIALDQFSLTCSAEGSAKPSNPSLQGYLSTVCRNHFICIRNGEASACLL